MPPRCRRWQKRGLCVSTILDENETITKPPYESVEDSQKEKNDTLFRIAMLTQLSRLGAKSPFHQDGDVGTW